MAAAGAVGPSAAADAAAANNHLGRSGLGDKTQPCLPGARLTGLFLSRLMIN